MKYLKWLGKDVYTPTSNSGEGEEVRKIVSNVFCFHCKVGSMVLLRMQKLGKGGALESYNYLNGLSWVL